MRKLRITAAVAAFTIALMFATSAFAIVSVPVTTDKPSYLPGQTVTIKPVYSGRTLSLVVKRPDGGVALSTTLRRSKTGFTTTYVLPGTAQSGTWSVAVAQGTTAAGGTTFGVTSPTPHADLKWADYPSNCRGCHAKQFGEMYGALHYQWQAPAPDNVNKPGTMQGKATNALNSYCINPLGNWKVCGKCHVGRGAQPVLTSTPTAAQLDNIDCLVCHNDEYSVARVRKSDGSMGVTTTDTAVLDGYVRRIGKPTRTACLKCHAFAGGGDSYKRGDITWAHKATADENFDVHMSTTGANLSCQNCHTFVGHKVTGKGSDLQSTDYASEIQCTKCHASAASEHDEILGRHMARVACQTCHIPAYARNASDTVASEATEINRDWRVPGTTVIPIHPTITTANNLTPKYRWWNRQSNSYLLGDTAVLDPATGAYPTSRPIGSVAGPLGNKLYPFKYKTATQPMRILGNVLIALDTNEYMNVSGDANVATSKGLFNMGFAVLDPFTWVKTDTFQLLNHEVPPAEGNALECSSCHGSTSRMDLKGELGYALKGPVSTVCTQCHGAKSEMPAFKDLHDKHVKDKNYDCSFCHNFTRPERGLRTTR